MITLRSALLSTLIVMIVRYDASNSLIIVLANSTIGALEKSNNNKNTAEQSLPLIVQERLTLKYMSTGRTRILPECPLYISA